jgi:hypothetical protein
MHAHDTSEAARSGRDWTSSEQHNDCPPRLAASRAHIPWICTRFLVIPSETTSTTRRSLQVDPPHIYWLVCTSRSTQQLQTVETPPCTCAGGIQLVQASENSVSHERCVDGNRSKEARWKSADTKSGAQAASRLRPQRQFQQGHGEVMQERFIAQSVCSRRCSTM